MRLWLRRSLRYVGSFFLLFVVGLAAFLAYSYRAAQVSTFDPGITPTTAERLIIENVRIITDGMDAPGAPSSLLIENGKIARIQPVEFGAELKDSALVIDGKGRFVLPGFIDMHAHIFDRSDLALYLAHGVTTVRNMMGFPMHLRWQGESQASDFAGAKMITSSPTLNTGGYIPFHAMVRSPKDARARVRQFRDEGYSFIKIYSDLSQELYEAVLSEARAQGLDVAGHVPYAVPFEKALTDGLVSIEHIEEIYYHPLQYSKLEEEHQDVADMIGAKPVALSTTITAYYNVYMMASDSEAFLSSVPMEWLTPIGRFFGERAASDDVSAEDLEIYGLKYEALQSITRKLYDNGVPLVLGTDTGPALTVPGYSFHREIERLKELNIPLAGIIEMATTNGARVLRREAELGTVREGAVADLVMVSENPFAISATLERPFAVIRDGKVYDREALEALGKAGETHISWPVTIGQLVEQLLAYGV